MKISTPSITNQWFHITRKWHPVFHSFFHNDDNRICRKSKPRLLNQSHMTKTGEQRTEITKYIIRHDVWGQNSRISSKNWTVCTKFLFPLSRLMLKTLKFWFYRVKRRLINLHHAFLNKHSHGCLLRHLFMSCFAMVFKTVFLAVHTTVFCCPQQTCLGLLCIFIRRKKIWTSFQPLLDSL